MPPVILSNITLHSCSIVLCAPMQLCATSDCVEEGGKTCEGVSGGGERGSEWTAGAKGGEGVSKREGGKGGEDVSEKEGGKGNAWKERSADRKDGQIKAVEQRKVYRKEDSARTRANPNPHTSLRLPFPVPIPASHSLSAPAELSTISFSPDEYGTPAASGYVISTAPAYPSSRFSSSRSSILSDGNTGLIRQSTLIFPFSSSPLRPSPPPSSSLPSLPPTLPSPTPAVSIAHTPPLALRRWFSRAAQKSGQRGDESEGRGMIPVPKVLRVLGEWDDFPSLRERYVRERHDYERPECERRGVQCARPVGPCPWSREASPNRGGGTSQSGREVEAGLAPRTTRGSSLVERTGAEERRRRGSAPRTTRTSHTDRLTLTHTPSPLHASCSLQAGMPEWERGGDIKFVGDEFVSKSTRTRERGKIFDIRQGELQAVKKHKRSCRWSSCRRVKSGRVPRTEGNVKNSRCEVPHGHLLLPLLALLVLAAAAIHTSRVTRFQGDSLSALLGLELVEIGCVLVGDARDHVDVPGPSSAYGRRRRLRRIGRSGRRKAPGCASKDIRSSQSGESRAYPVGKVEVEDEKPNGRR
ncbi:hypothetical protein B0H12DRAFT_1081819 [Mycena haematopus]|nr:hypothetical protein B0H12DRAFT_1081819 [Mycena haematopus]